MAPITYNPLTVELQGSSFPATYRVNRHGVVTVSVTVLDNDGYTEITLTRNPGDVEYAAALEAAQAARPVDPAKQAHGDIPEKFFVGMEIKGRGWKIIFDGGYDRTRVIFKRKPSAAAREAVKAAGFSWSPSLESWNKKLTHRAYRAAQALAFELKTICG